VGHLVEKWTRKQFQTKLKTKAKGGAFYHMVATTGVCVPTSTSASTSRQPLAGPSSYRTLISMPHSSSPPLLPHFTVCLSVLPPGFLGFVDDLAVELACVDLAGDGAASNNATVVVRMQSEQRFGTLDGGVNKKRVASLISYINHKARGLPAGTCSPPV
jgi:hypothetical protein